VQEEDDWESILAAETKKNASSEQGPPVPEPEVSPPPAPADDPEKPAVDAAAAFLASMGGNKEAGEAKPKDKKKKKKKKGASATSEAKKEEKKPSKQSAAGRMIAQKLAEQKAEEERLRKLQEEEEARIRAIEEERLAEERRVAEEKERKRLAKKEKKEKAKAEGRYKTKAEKERDARNAAALEQMRAAGLVPVSELDGSEGGKKKKPVYGKKKKKSPKAEQKDPQEAEKPTETQEAAPEEPPKPEEVTEGADDWEAAADSWEDAPDDWESNLNLNVEANLNLDSSQNGPAEEEEEEEDELEKEKRLEQEKLRQLGLEREKLEEERRRQAEEEARLAEELAREQREAEMKKEIARKKRLEREAKALEERSADDLRCPVICIMGHVDTGKTKLLDNIRCTNVQEGEAGGITQQIGATFFSADTLDDRINAHGLRTELGIDIKVPGVLIIDTPGHEAFSNLRSRGSSLCDIAILVIDMMHGLEPQTLESISLLKRKRTPFVVALNKVDRLYNWKACNNMPIQMSLAQQEENTVQEFHDRMQHVRVQLMEQGLNAELYWENNDPGSTISLCPTSAITGEGVPDILLKLIQYSQERLMQKIMYISTLQCTVLEVKVIDGLGTTVDVIMVNGALHEGDTIVCATVDGPVVTTIRALLTPPPSRELRIKSEYIHHQTLKAAIGVKISAQNLEKVVAGTSLMVIGPEDDENDIKEEVMKDMSIMSNLKVDAQGVMVQASTLGALEALLEFLRNECDPPIPVSAANIGPIHKKDVMRASIMLEKGKKEYATILAFDVNIDKEARELADEYGVRIFTADIIYHLFDQFTRYMDQIMEARRAEAQSVAVFPVVFNILPNHIFNKKDPIIVGAEIIDGILKIGTPLIIPQQGGLEIGRICSIENNHKEVNTARKGDNVALQIRDENNPTLTFGRQFDHKFPVYSKITRESIDALKEFFKDEMSKEDWKLVIKMKKIFNIQ